jgi:hypothetical protein
VELVEGSNGIFDVSIDKKLVYQKSKECGNFPIEGEVNHRIAEYLAD